MASQEQLKAYRFRLKLTGEQERLCEQTDGCTRFVWNWFLGQRESWYCAASEVPAALRDDTVVPNSYEAQANQIRHLKAFYPWLGEAPYHCLQQALKDLHRAYQNFFEGRAAYPCYRRKGRDGGSFRFPDPKAIRRENNTLKLPKLGVVELVNSFRRIRGEIRSVTVSRRGKHWYASVLYRRERKLPMPSTGPAVGIDLGVANVVSLSTGERVKPCSFTKLERAKRKQQRILARRRKGSANWKKTKTRLGRIHIRIGDKRNDFLHKLSTAISKNHAQVVVENLQVGNMTKSAKGTPEDPGVNVKAKAGLNRSILEQGWGEFVRQLNYKTQWRGGVLVKVDHRYTSQRCSCCGHIAPENRPSQAVFRCVRCGHSEHADTNAAKNILARATSSGLTAVGLTVTACESNRIGGRKQERAKRKLSGQSERISHAA